VPIWNAELIWRRLQLAAEAPQRGDPGHAEVISWPAMHVHDPKLLPWLYSALNAHLSDLTVADYAKQRHGISERTFKRHRKAACAQIAKGVNAAKWQALQDGGSSNSRQLLGRLSRKSRLTMS
jgi:hypothetical protein